MSEISAAFPFESKTVNVHGANLHYVEQGQGDPILFLHGVPTSSYLWRNILPRLSSQGRCIAVDLIGLGKSDKPDIAYSIADHIHYIEGFIEALNLKNITLVMHAWGSVIGFDYAMRHQDNIKGLAFFEAHVRPVGEWEKLSLLVQEIASLLKTKELGYDVITNSNYYVNKVMRSGVLRRLSDEELRHYYEPFTLPGSGKPIWQYLQDLPLGDGPKEPIEIINRYSQQLCQSTIPKLMFYAVPGFITTIDTVGWAKQHLPNIELADIGDALHYAQESNPEIMAEVLAKWHNKAVLGNKESQTQPA